ncbi:sigma-54-dependent transcriptional regulator [Sandaracinus amylolyticus]|uniref:sigma-54-dependent transcriptional regulator n=1 Tax=Sandaracinus amylolyticus TaxID=927083 RepID=UPI001F17BD98|nr:sigma-54 dependent transcriptional regulator [Sandaracinus amylolyticus]UJR78756.1 DNA-binding transcriptional regulator NtrC [Sandaracinus amylolyticus]
MPPSRILVVDDDEGVVEWLLEELVERGYAASGVTSPAEALQRVARERFDLVVSDVEMPGMRGIDLVQAIHARSPDQLVLLITAFGSIDLAMQAVRAGAADFLAKPFTIEALLQAIERTLRERRLRRQVVRVRASLGDESPPGDLVAESAAMKRVLELARRAAASGSTVLLTGESGVGKSAIARYVHAHSARRDRAFVQLNCAALPAGLVEAELFGVRRGAYTDAREDRRGVFVDADRGTLFLDEVADMALEVQPKLLVALESGSIRPLGARDEVRVDVRLIAATNRSLEEDLRERRLRADLYHRLNVIRIDVPPLRERLDDLPRLVDTLLARLAPRASRPLAGVSEEAMRWLRAQPWTGNVRELANVVERAVMLTDHDVLVLEDFVEGRAIEESDLAFLTSAAEEGIGLDELELRYIRRVLERCGGNKAKAAQVLGIDRSTLWRKLGGGS